MTVLIGPQGSGKSVTTKLNYFFCDLFSKQHQFAEKGCDLSELKRDIARQFRVWFPSTAWGSDRFNITFTAGLVSIRILRKMTKGKMGEDVSITLSPFFSEQYEQLCAAYKEIQSDPIADDSRSIRRSLEGSFKIRDAYEKRMIRTLGPSYISSQVFIPAGRAFFTSIGRLVAAIEQGNSLDPVTTIFAKLFASLRDYSRRRIIGSAGLVGSHLELRQIAMDQLFGGTIKFERELEYVETLYGRRVPFNALSSGQQELLPMWTSIDFFSARNIVRASGSDIFYIEEPEAHLFPAAQSVLMDFCISTLVSGQERRNLVLTTHSPYILSKLNNYLKAGLLGKSKRNAERVAELVKRDCWLTPDRVLAYSIEGGTLKTLIGEDGLIDASYIDSVSEEVSKVFSALLDIQYPETLQ